MALGMEVGLGPGHIDPDGDSAPFRACVGDGIASSTNGAFSVGTRRYDVPGPSCFSIEKKSQMHATSTLTCV